MHAENNESDSYVEIDIYANLYETNRTVTITENEISWSPIDPNLETPGENAVMFPVAPPINGFLFDKDNRLLYRGRFGTIGPEMPPYYMPFRLEKLVDSSLNWGNLTITSQDNTFPITLDFYARHRPSRPGTEIINVTHYITLTFQLKPIGYSFANDYESFGYDKNKINPIPREVFKRIYPHTWRMEHYKYQWGGNCYGMTTTAMLFYNNIWHEENFHAGIKATPNFPEAKDVPKLLKEIEAYQICNGNIPKQENGIEYKNNVPELLYRLQNNINQTPILFTVRDKEKDPNSNSYNTHSIVLLGTERLIGNGDDTSYHKIVVYDPNYPLDPNSPYSSLRYMMLLNNPSVIDWEYGSYNSSDSDFFIDDLNAVKTYIDNITQNPLSAPKPNIKFGTDATASITAHLPNKDIAMTPSDFSDETGTINRILTRMGAEIYQEFNTAQSGKMGFSAVANGYNFIGFLFDANGGGMIETSSSVANLPYTLTVDPGNSVLLDSAKEDLNTNCAFFFKGNNDILNFNLQTEHTGSLFIERMNNTDFKVTGNNLTNSTIGDGENVLFHAASLPNGTVLRLQYSNDGEIKRIALASESEQTIPVSSTKTPTTNKVKAITKNDGDALQSIAQISETEALSENTANEEATRSVNAASKAEVPQPRNHSNKLLWTTGIGILLVGMGALSVVIIKRKIAK